MKNNIEEKAAPYGMRITDAGPEYFAPDTKTLKNNKLEGGGVDVAAEQTLANAFRVRWGGGGQSGSAVQGSPL